MLPVVADLECMKYGKILWKLIEYSHQEMRKTYGIQRQFIPYKKRKRNVAGRACSAVRCVAAGDIQVGEWSFPNKRILRNNLCLPACKLLYLDKREKNFLLTDIISDIIIVRN